MAFDIAKFSTTKFEARTAVVPVPEWAEYFAEGDKLEWKVRNLSGKELAKADVARENATKYRATIEGLFSESEAKIRKAVKQMYDPNVTPEMAKAIAIFRMGSVEPEVEQAVAVRICDHFPKQFYRIVAKINELSGKGSMPGKLKPSGKKKKSN